MKSVLDALFLSTYILSLLFVLINCTIPLIFHIAVRLIREVSQARSTVTTCPVSGASCYIIRGTLLQQRTWCSQSKCHSYMLTVITLLGLHTFIHLIHGMHNNVGIHSFIY